MRNPKSLLIAGAALLLGLVLASFAGSPSAHGQAKEETVADMDLDYLREKLLKM